ncbi:tRNA (cytidine(34)-2'-O)-methyltransferase [Mesoplasma lactucae ATCC 49193]|nr:tRNA (cytidine(34)-2'-O)-methyltransferase [Mesoplasma lactucae]ATZ20099.1 RNA methyltransferase [Mesoplasma lactucae ATCC 49193]MCL8216847.1 tRNA (cytidine(34)-2'-O)-methyltransferase [Mesoplasma lactucae ATCC 49193]
MRKVNIVLFEPEIANNTAAIMRTCVAFDMRLHIIEPLGFILNEHNMSRGSANEYKKVDMIRYDNWADFEKKHPNTPLYCLSRYGQKPISDFNFTEIEDEVYLMFGRESTGIDKEILYNHFDTTFRIPMVKDARSINIANTVGIASAEVLRQWDYPGLEKKETQRGADYILSRRWEKE